MKRDDRLSTLNATASILWRLKIRCMKELRKEVPDAAAFSPLVEWSDGNPFRFNIYPNGHNRVIIVYLAKPEAGITREVFQTAFERAIKSLLGKNARLLLEIEPTLELQPTLGYIKE